MLHTYSLVSTHFLRKASLATLGLGGALFVATTAQAQIVSGTPKIEAENATNTLTGPGIVVSTAITGSSGTGYVDFGGKPTSLSIPYTAAAAGDYDIVIRYESRFGTTSPNDAKIGALSVNNGPKSPLYFNGTAPGITGAPNFRSTTARRITLATGVNTIVISDNDYGYFGVDYVQIAPSAATPTALTPTAAGRVEAEAGQLVNAQGLVRDDDTSTRSGTLYVGTGKDGLATNGSITLPITVATAGLYQIAVGARGLFDGKSFDLAVQTGTTNGGKYTVPLTSASGSTAAFTSFAAGKYNLAAGTTTLTITTQTGYVDIDYVDVTATTGVATAARASADAQKALTAYPNPTNGQALNVNLELAAAQETTFDLVNALGQRVSTATRSLRAGTNQLQLPTAGVAGGLYQLVVRSGDKPTLVQRVVVN